MRRISKKKVTVIIKRRKLLYVGEVIMKEKIWEKRKL